MQTGGPAGAKNPVPPRFVVASCEAKLALWRVPPAIRRLNHAAD